MILIRRSTSIAEGALEVLIPDQNNDLTRIGIRETDAVIGEQAFVDSKPRSSTIRALTDGTILRLNPESLEVLRVREPDMAHDIVMDLARLLSVKLRQATAVMA